MKYDFARLKAGVDIVDVIGRKIRLSKKGSEYVGVCPWHNDSDPSLHVNRTKQVFTCPVCTDKSGDVIDFLLAFGYTYKEAAEELHGGPLDKPAPEKRELPKRTKPVQWTQVLPGEDAPAPVFTHYKFGDPAKVWEYKTADGSTSGYVCRFNHADGSKDVLPFIYATDGKRVSWRYHAFDRPRPLFNLDRIADAKVVILVEGEKAADFLGSVLPTHTFTCWTGGTNAVHFTDFTPLHGKTVIYWPDNDAPGRKAMAYIAAELKAHAQQEKFVHVPADLPKGWDGADVDWDEDGLRKWLRANMHDEIWAPDVEPQKNNNNETIENPNDGHGNPVVDEAKPTDSEDKRGGTPPPKPRGKKEDPRDNPFFRVLGFETDENGAVFVFFNKRMNCITRASVGGLTKNFFEFLAPSTFWETILPDGKDPERVQWVINSCGSKLIFEEANIRGRGAWFDEGRAVLHTGQRLFVDGEPVALGDFDTEYIYAVGSRMNFEPRDPMRTNEARKLVDLLRRLRWERDVNAELLAGWCVVAAICGALDWRPHIWVTGAAGTGKSWVFENVVSRIVGNIALRVQGETTEAGVRQSLGHDARPVIFDETEAEDKKAQDRVQSILGLMRGASTSDGGLTVKGSAGGSAKTYQIRSCFAFASIGVAVSQQSDRSRITMLTLAKRGLNGDEWESFKHDYVTTITDEYIDALRSRIIRMIPTIKKNAKTFAKACAIVLGSQRAGDQAGALLAGAYALESDGLISDEAALELVKRHDWNEEKGLDTTRDEVRLFNHLMEQIVRVDEGGYTERNVGELIAVATNQIFGDHLTPEAASRKLARVGIKVDGDYIVISNTANELIKFLKDTAWAKNHNKVLGRLDGAKTYESTRFSAGIKSRAVGVPLSLLEFDTPAPKQTGLYDKGPFG